MFFCFPPGIHLSAKGRARPKWPKTPVFRDFPPVGSSRPNHKMQKSCIFGDKFLGWTYFLLKSAPRSGKLHSSVSLSATSLTSLSAKGVKPQYFAISRLLGVRSGKTQNVKKLWTTIPDSVVFFFDFGTPSAVKLRFSVFSPRP